MPAISFIDAVPNHISVEEHRSLTGVTPSSFSDIPPVLQQKVDNVRVAFDPPLDDFSPDDAALGTLYIIERYVPSPTPLEVRCGETDTTTTRTHRAFSFSFFSATQRPRISILHGAHLPDRVPVHNPARHLAR
jgi:hypothetical protein